MVRAFAHGAMGRRINPSWGGPIELFLVPASAPRHLCYPVCGMVHIKEPLLLIKKSSPCGGSRFPLSLSEWSFTICLTPCNPKIKCVECVVKQNISFLLVREYKMLSSSRFYLDSCLFYNYYYLNFFFTLLNVSYISFYVDHLILN